MSKKFLKASLMSICLLLNISVNCAQAWENTTPTNEYTAPTGCTCPTGGSIDWESNGYPSNTYYYCSSDGAYFFSAPNTGSCSCPSGTTLTMMDCCGNGNTCATCQNNSYIPTTTPSSDASTAYVSEDDLP